MPATRVLLDNVVEDKDADADADEVDVEAFVIGRLRADNETRSLNGYWKSCKNSG